MLHHYSLCEKKCLLSWSAQRPLGWQEMGDLAGTGGGGARICRKRDMRKQRRWDTQGRKLHGTVVFRAPYEELHDFVGSKSKIHVLMDLEFVELVCLAKKKNLMLELFFSDLELSSSFSCSTIYLHT
jgi:hypothetical protein